MRYGYDESFYLAQATSMAWDHDWDLRNNLDFLNYKPGDTYLYTWKSVFPIGSSLCMVPPLAWGLARGMSWDAMQWTLGAWSAFWAIIGVGITASALSRFVSGRRAWVCATVAFLSVPAWHYSFWAPGYSHGFAGVMVAAFIWAVLTEKRLALCGLLLGAVYLTRWADVVPCGAFLGLCYLLTLKRPWRARGLAVVGVGTFLCFALVAQVQWWFWHHEFGVWFLEPQRVIPRWAGGLMQWAHPRWSDIPAMWPETVGVPLAAAVLVAALFRRDRYSAVKVAALVALGLGVYLQMACGEPGGAQFGLRRLAGLYPLVALGLASSAFRREA